MSTLECCSQCAFKHSRQAQYCGYMGNAHQYYILDCETCGKTVVNQTGQCCANNCKENHGGKWHLTFSSPGVLLKVFDPISGQSLVGKDEDV